MVSELALPRLALQTTGSIAFLTDDALASSVGITVGFTLRQGGVSKPPYDALNLGAHVNDDLADVQRNRELLCAAVGVSPDNLIVPSQVHGTNYVAVEANDAASVNAAREQAQLGCDALMVNAPDVMALLCFADCTPVIVVSPTGRFTVAHAGWRGAYAGIVGLSIDRLAAADAAAYGLDGRALAAGMNVYIGPYIHVECFEVDVNTANLFRERYGESVLADSRHVNLGAVVALDALSHGASAERICDADICTKCSTDKVFSYRASGGTCGRHGAFAVRK